LDDQEDDPRNNTTKRKVPIITEELSPPVPEKETKVEKKIDK